MINISKRFNSEKGLVTVKKYRDRYKLTYHTCLRLKGFEECDFRDRIEVPTEKGISLELKAKEKDWYFDNINVYVDDLTGEEYYTYDIKENEKPKKKFNGKLANNIIRAKSKIYEYALCNDWDFFATFTIDKEKYDRYNLKEFKKAFTQKIRNINKKYNCKIKYLLIPEQHKDGAWHMHGFLSGLPDQEIRAFDKSEHLPLYLIDKIIKGEKVFTWISYQKKFGFCDLEPIKDIYKASSYVTKYVTKVLEHSVTECNADLYYHSQGLNKASEVLKGFLDNPSEDGMEYDFENEYVKVKWLEEEDYIFIKDFIDKY